MIAMLFNADEIGKDTLVWWTIGVFLAFAAEFRLKSSKDVVDLRRPCMWNGARLGFFFKIDRLGWLIVSFLVVLLELVVGEFCELMLFPLSKNSTESANETVWRRSGILGIPQRAILSSAKSRPTTTRVFILNPYSTDILLERRVPIKLNEY